MPGNLNLGIALLSPAELTLTRRRLVAKRLIAKSKVRQTSTKRRQHLQDLLTGRQREKRVISREEHGAQFIRVAAE